MSDDPLWILWCSGWLYRCHLLQTRRFVRCRLWRNRYPRTGVYGRIVSLIAVYEVSREFLLKSFRKEVELVISVASDCCGTDPCGDIDVSDVEEKLSLAELINVTLRPAVHFAWRVTAARGWWVGGLPKVCVWLAVNPFGVFSQRGEHKCSPERVPVLRPRLFPAFGVCAFGCLFFVV